MLAPAAFGLDRYVITGGSMGATIPKGSIAYTREVPVADLRVGDVITYMPPPDAGPDHLVTHRIVSIGRDASGPVYRTKGDANPVADPWTFRLDHSTQARVRIGIPYAGYALAALGRRDVRLAVIALPALLIALLSLGRLWRALGEEARRRALEESA
jgi:signal peptidase